MIRYTKYILLFLLPGVIACDSLQHVQSQAENYGVDTEKAANAVGNELGVDLGSYGVGSKGNSGGVSDSEVLKGLKEALSVGTRNAVSMLNKENGYLNDQAVKILFPNEVAEVATKLRDLGMGSLVDNFEQSLNRAAEDAALEAQKIFVNSILQMSFSDARSILTGGNGAATNYFKQSSNEELYGKFYSKIEASLSKVNATKYWGDITSAYNIIPGVKKVETDIADYTTKKAISGLFSKIEIEENKIRQEPAARVTDILAKVFGSL